MEDKTFKLIEKMYGEMQKGFKSVDERFEQIDSRFEQIDSRFEQIDQRFDKVDNRLDNFEKEQKQIKDYLIEIDVKNTTRYVELKDSIDYLRKSLTTVEAVAVRNWTEILELKRAK